MSVACAAGGTAAGGRLLLLLRWLVVMGVCEDQTLRGRGGRWFSSSTHRLLQQRGEVQTSKENSWLGQLENAAMSSLPAPIHFWHIQIDFGKSGQQKKNNMCNAIFEDQIQPTSDLI